MVLSERLDDETFGEQLRRARARRQLNAREVAERMSGCWPVSHNLLHRLETERAVPTDKRRRIIAALYAIALGYEPAVFGLSRDDIPPAIDVSALAPQSTVKMNRAAGRPSRKRACVTGVDAPVIELRPAAVASPETRAA